MTKSIVLGGGCFWCTEAVFQRVKGVTSVQSGYCGGVEDNPTYEQVASGLTDYVESVKVEYDDSVINLETIFEIFLKTHDPTTLNRQGNDLGTQYRSVIFTNDAEEMSLATKVIERVDGEKIYPDPIVTTVDKFEKFYPAEEYHEDYYNQNRNQPYCRIVIDPKIRKFLDQFKDQVKSLPSLTGRAKVASSYEMVGFSIVVNASKSSSERETGISLYSSES